MSLDTYNSMLGLTTRKQSFVNGDDYWTLHWRNHYMQFGDNGWRVTKDRIPMNDVVAEVYQPLPTHWEIQ